MRTTLSPVRAPRARWLYAGVAVFVLLTALTARTVWIAWNDRAGQARTAAVFELVQQRTPSRPVDAPGAIAWLRDQLSRYRTHLDPDSSTAFARLSGESAVVPTELDGVAGAMRALPALALTLTPFRALPHTAVGDLESSRRSVTLLPGGAATLVVTRRRALETDAASNAFIATAVPAMVHTAERIDREAHGAARPVRLYAIAEDGTLVSRPWGPSDAPAEAIARREATQLGGRPTLPSFAPEEFFFRFERGDTGSVRYSGFYVDLGGRGLVSTLMMPITLAGQSGVLALDLTHAVNWDHFASTIPAPLAATIVHTDPGTSETWTGLRQSLPAAAAPAIVSALDQITRREMSSQTIEPIAHAVVGADGAVAAFHVSDGAWLLTFFPSAAPAFPGGAVALLGAVLAVLLVGFEVNRRRAEREADRAARALIEKQNLLNTMQVPLVVVDPNTDEIVSANQVAESIGIKRGARFADRIARQPRALEHYERTQVATSAARRAYGVPIRIETSTGTIDQFALVRSVAVTAPIEALAADERHRLAILFLVDPHSDLRLLLDDVERGAHADERRRLAGLLSHGVDPVADVLRRTLVADSPHGTAAAWLAEYLQRRIHVTAWLLDHWGEPPPAHDAIVDAEQARDTLRSLEEIYATVRGDRDLRSRLGWMNGPLSRATDEPPFAWNLDWPDEFETTLPVRGGLGFFLTEVLSNAMQHAAPDSRASVVVRCDRVRRELSFEIQNTIRDGQVRPGSRYGGLALLEGMAALFGWREFKTAAEGTTFTVSWSAPLTRRDRPGHPD